MFYTTGDQTYETPTSISRMPLTQEKVLQMMSLLPYMAFDKLVCFDMVLKHL